MKAWLFAAALGLFCASPALAQETPEPAPPPAGAEAGEDEEVVVVQGYRDRAMQAYLRGDFAVAEQEFANNLSCIQRVETLRDWAFDQASTSAMRSEAATGASMGLESGPVVVTERPASTYAIQNRRARVPERTCEGPDWQLYMMGMSQIGQGRFSEAKENLIRVIQTSNNQYLFDAHYRVGLLELLDGNIEEADDRLRHLRRMRRICNARGASCEIRGELEYAIAYLGASINAARRGELRRY